MSKVIIYALVPITTYTTNTNKYICESEVPAIISKIKGAEFFSMKYIKKDGSYREATCQLHVSNPRNEAITPNGKGETAREALKDGRIKYYEAHHAETKQGVYRQCRIDRLVSLKIHGVTYNVIH